MEQKRYSKYLDDYVNTKNKFFFIHDTFSSETILKILEDGFIKPGKELEWEYIKRSGQKLDNIYVNIYFYSLKNIPIMPSYAIIIDPNILNTHNAVFNKGWGGIIKPDIYLSKKDSPKQRRDKISSIREFIKDPKELPEKLKNSGVMTHQVLFNRRIPIDSIIGIICTKCPDKTINKIKEIIDVPVFTTNLFTI